jgi:hypothetical protein
VATKNICDFTVSGGWTAGDGRKAQGIEKERIRGSGTRATGNPRHVPSLLLEDQGEIEFALGKGEVGGDGQDLALRR